MKKATKAVLFNALLFPGWGQIYLKQYKKGVLIISAIMAGTLSILWSVIQITRDTLKIAPFKKGTVTFDAVIQLAINSIKSMNCFHLSLILFFMLLLWIFSMIDAYKSGKKLQGVISVSNQR
ncbi:hypothetical protein SMITH_291 [Smithella sp. ME-1]|uniref:DUF5683 domain-containing protein n=1 Tax=hydrocarbon metagenome TaxID=938273 RepID=A0A0W8FUF4_9ZZZZ|nr:hypothetical protein SMITH_291 [Smithella sp. ME-1]